MRRLCAIAILTISAACSQPKRPVVTPEAQAPARLAGADALVKAGCFECLLSAYREYTVLRAFPSVAEAATAGAVRSAALLAARERELGTEDSGYLQRAQELAATTGTPNQQVLIPPLEITDTLLTRGGTRQVGDDVELARMQMAYRNRDAWTEWLRVHADEDPLAAYLSLAFNCAYVPAGQQAIAEWVKRVPAWSETSLIRFKAATCAANDAKALDALLQADGRFVELNYHLGLSAMLGGRIDEAIERLQRAHAWRARWPANTTALASLYLTLEEYDQAVEFYDRTLAVVPAHPDALLGRARGLTYAGKYAESLETIERLLALERWLIGDARYWRAYNETQLARNDEAWEDIELAAKSLVNAEVPKLAGLIAYRRKQVEVARVKFDESYTRNRLDCETGYYLGVVLAEQANWGRTTDVLVETGSCLAAAEKALTAEIDTIQTSSDPPSRKQRQIARRERQIATGRRMMATSWFNVAVAYYNLARKPEARQYAEKIVDDEQFGERARDLLTRLR
jgi:tetratricopeptide (TPR) repeat protein